MSNIRSKDTIPEFKVRRYLFNNGFRFRLHDYRLPGKPDLVLKKYKVAIFVNGCFWHGHIDCKFNNLPKTNTEYWTKKISKNKDRDKINYERLNLLGWRVILIWECDIKRKNYEKVLNKLTFEIINKQQTKQ
jgi:DNA mismatch endonuclease (patch repair protein)